MKIKFYKALICCMLTISAFSPALAQDDKALLEQIDSVAKQMFANINTKNFDGLLDMTHPKVFDLAPKETMRTVIKSMFEGNGDYTIEVPNMLPEYKLSEIYKDSTDNAVYSFLSYDMRMTMTFKNEDFDAETQEMMISMMKAQGMNVKFISNKAMDVIIPDSLTIIIKDDNTDDKWVAINYDADSPLFYQIVSSGLIENAKAYKQKLMLESKKDKE